MQVVYNRCCGLDVHKKTIVACVLITLGPGEVQRHIRTFSTMTAGLLALSDWLEGLQVSVVAMESTGVYWQPVFNLLEEGRQIILVNAAHMKAVPGRKTDVKDSEWIAQLLQHGLLSPSFIPPAPVRALRQLTRYRKTVVQERARHVNRVHKLLETANLKLGAVASDVLGKSGRSMLDAIVKGEQDPQVLAELARGRLRKKLPELRLALDGRVQSSHRFLLKRLLSHIDFLDGSLESVQKEIDEHMKQFQEAMTLIQSLPLELHTAAAAVIAEIGVDMTRFPSAEHLASWAGLCPGNCESAGKQLSGKTRHGNPYLRSILCEMALIVIRMKETYLSAFYHRIAGRRGHKRAVVAVAHKLLVIIYSMLKNKTPYQELGADHFDQLDPKKAERRAIARLERLGYHVTLTRDQEVAPLKDQEATPLKDQEATPLKDQEVAPLKDQEATPLKDQEAASLKDQKAAKGAKSPSRKTVPKARKAVLRKVQSQQALTRV